MQWLFVCLACYTGCITGGGDTVEGVVAVHKGVEGGRRQGCGVDSDPVLYTVHHFCLKLLGHAYQRNLQNMLLYDTYCRGV